MEFLKQTSKPRLYFIGLSVVIVFWRLWLAGHLGLGDDEGYYWDWHNHLALGYFDHPPLVAWLIALGQMILPKSEWTVRLLFIVLSAVSALGFYRLCQLLHVRSPFLNSTLLFVYLPLYSFGGFMAFPDIPMLAAWIGTLWLSVRLEAQPANSRLWLLLGIFIGLAVLSKLTGFLLLFSVFVWTLSTADLRAYWRRSGPWLAVFAFVLVISPMVMWNVQHDFPSFRFQLIERHASPHFRIDRFFQALLLQLLFVSPFILVMISKECVTSFRQQRWAMCFALPSLLVFFLQPLFSGFQPHWPAPAYLPLLAVMSWQITPAFKANFIYLIVVNLLFLLICTIPVMEPVYNLLPLSSAWRPNFDFSNDLYGWPEAGRWVHDLALDVRRTRGQMPALLTSRYQLAGNLSFYSGQLASAYGGRANAYRLFEDSPYHKDFSQTPLLFVADNRYSDGPEKNGKALNCHKKGQLSVLRLGRLARTFFAWQCDGFEK